MTYNQYPIFKESLDGRERVEFRDLEYGKILKHPQKKHVGEICYLPRHNNESLWRDCPSDVNKSYYYEVIEGTLLKEKLYTDVEIEISKRHLDKIFIKTGRRFEL